MKLRHLTLLLCVSLSLTGCSALLERNYATVEPHSSKFWESEAAGTLRAENYQDIVNDLLILIGQHTESATVRLYNYEDDLTVADTLEQATTEVQQETPMGAYAVEYITASSRSQRGYYEISIQVSYRRTAEQIQAVVNATSTEALSALLEAALDEGRTELAVRVGYWGEDGQARVEETVAQLREARGLAETPPWTISYYPAQGPVGLVSIQSGAATYYIDNNTVEGITYRNQPVFSIFPMDKIPETQALFLEDFKWEGHRRPVLREVFDRTIRPSERAEKSALPRPDFPITRRIEEYKTLLIESGTWVDRDDKLTPEALEWLHWLGY